MPTFFRMIREELKRMCPVFINDGSNDWATLGAAGMEEADKQKPTLVMRIGFLYVRNNRFSITS